MIKVIDRKAFSEHFKSYTSLNIQGVLLNTKYEAFTDSLEDPKGVYIRDGYFNFLFTESNTFIKEFEETVVGDGFIGFSGTNQFVYDYFHKHFPIQWENTCGQYHYPGGKFEVEPLEALCIEDAELVNDLYEYKNDDSLSKIKDAILNRPTSALRLDGELVAFVLIHDDDSIGYMFVKDEHRKKGYATMLTKDILNKVIDFGRLPYIQIVHGNDKSVGLALKTGFEKHGDVHWFGYINQKGAYIQACKDKYEKKYGQKIKGLATFNELSQEEKIDIDLQSVIETYHVDYYEDDEVLYIKSDPMEEALFKGLLMGLMHEDAHLALYNLSLDGKGLYKVH
jgi:GNAT superfamily N-acetyltransferase